MLAVFNLYFNPLYSTPKQPVYCSMFLKFSSTGELLGITSLCKLASISKIKEMCVGTFIKTKHALDMSFTAIDSR